MTLKGCKFAAGGGADPASPWRKGYEGGRFLVWKMGPVGRPGQR